MDYCTGIETLPGAARGAVIAIGNFDGVHRGHRALLDVAMRRAGGLGVKTGVLTFEPHPRSVFRPDDPPFRITPAPVKRRRLDGTGIDFACALPFDWAFASRSAEAFIDAVLRRGFSPSAIVVGPDFRFGQLRRGTPDLLRAEGFETVCIDPVTTADGAVFSSSAIREALRRADLETANALLGWDWEIEGTVEQGDRRGRELGYPTANVSLGETLHPGYGVYAALVRIGAESAWRPAAINIGIRPMFELKVGRVEAHILDFDRDRDIYGETLSIRPVKRLRGEAKFDSLEALIAQIQRDCEDADALLKSSL